jgi:hypothetical protein
MKQTSSSLVQYSSMCTYVMWNELAFQKWNQMSILLLRKGVRPKLHRWASVIFIAMFSSVSIAVEIFECFGPRSTSCLSVWPACLKGWSPLAKSNVRVQNFFFVHQDLAATDRQTHSVSPWVFLLQLKPRGMMLAHCNLFVCVNQTEFTAQFVQWLNDRISI